jgi:hypothetical protein
MGENEWLEGGEAIEMMLAAIPSRLPKVRKKASSSDSRSPVKAKAKPAAKKGRSDPKRKPRVCVDLDGVIAAYNGWKGFGEIGSPLPGALEFITKLSSIADVVIFTSRCSLDPGGDAGTVVASPEELRVNVVDWLREHDFPFADVYIGQGKPKAAAFIDDRAIPCRPQEDAAAFDNTLKALTSLLKKK